MPVFFTLNDYLFLGTEVPEKLNFGGKQNMAVHELVGGQRIVDAMGKSDDDITWSGLFFMENSLFRARFIDSLRSAGNLLTFTYSQFTYTVLIKEFKADFERFYQIPYTITLQVVADLTQPINIVPLGSFNDAILEAMIEANALSVLIQNDPIAAAIALLNLAEQLIPSFQNATAAQISGFINVAQSALSVTTTQITSLTSSLF